MSLDYDEFRRMDQGERIARFSAIDAEAKAELVRTHISRWLASHRGQLTAEQIEAVEQCREFVSPGLYTGRPDAALAARARQVEERAAALLTRDQMREALTLHW